MGQSFKTFGYGCASCWGDVGAGDAEADVVYISFIVSVQYIGYLRTTESRCTVPDMIIFQRGTKSFPLGITHVNADNSPVHVTVLLSDSNIPSDL